MVRIICISAGCWLSAVIFILDRHERGGLFSGLPRWVFLSVCGDLFGLRRIAYKTDQVWAESGMLIAMRYGMKRFCRGNVLHGLLLQVL
jgi:hypothetical protein